MPRFLAIPPPLAIARGASTWREPAPFISTIDGMDRCAHDIPRESPEIGERAIVPLASGIRAADMSRPHTEDSDS
jgi:hypothetical protein